MKDKNYSLRILEFIKGNYSDKEFFTSKKFKERVSSLARIVTNRYKSNKNYVPITTDVYWDENDEMKACTNNNVIRINMATDLLKGLSKNDRALGIWGMLAHELGHCLYTDFLLMRKFLDVEEMIKNGVDSVWDFKSHLSEETYNFFKSHLMVSTLILKELQNILEDPYIEYRITKIYTGSFKRGIVFIKSILQKHIETSIISGKYDYLSLMLAQARNCLPEDFLVKYPCLAETQKVFDKLYLEPTPTMKDRLNMTLTLFDLLFDDFIKDDFENKSDEEIQQQIQDMKNNNNQSNTNNNENQQTSGMANPNSSKQQQNENNSEQSASSEKSNNSSDSSRGESSDNAENNADDNNSNANGSDLAENADIEKESNCSSNSSDDFKDSSDCKNCDNNESGESEKPDDSENPNSDNRQENAVERNGDSNEVDNKSDYDSNSNNSNNSDNTVDTDVDSGSKNDATDNIDSLSTSYNDDSSQHYENEITGDSEEPDVKEFDVDDVINSIAKSLSNEENVMKSFENYEIDNEICQGIHKNVDYSVLNIDTGSKDLYQKYVSEGQLKKISKQAQNKVRDAVLQRKRSQPLKRQERGNRVDINAFARRKNDNDMNVFINSKKPSKDPLMAVSVIVDASGSMNFAQGSKIKYATLASIIMEDFCKNLNIPFSLISHRYSDGGVRIYDFVSFDDTSVKRKYNLTKLPSYTGSCNRDGFALRYAMMKLKRRHEPFKIMIIISDGLPSAYSSGEEAVKDIFDIREECKNKNIELLAFVIDGNIDGLSYLYGEDNVVDCRELEKFPKEISKILAEKSQKIYK